jgi:hypothetical protein
MTTPIQLLHEMNETYSVLHKNYESLFWTFYMGDHSLDRRMNEAAQKLDEFKSSPLWIERINTVWEHATLHEQERLNHWKKFFNLYQTSVELQKIKNKIINIDSKMHKRASTYVMSYVDPSTGKKIKASKLELDTLMRTSPDEKIRKACFNEFEKMATIQLDDYLTFVKLLNEFAQVQGYEDYYDYNLRKVEGISKKDLFSMFDTIYQKTSHAFSYVRDLEKSSKNLRKPWNYQFMLSGDFVVEEDQYYPFNKALERWGRSFAAMGITMNGGKLTLDLLDRKGKYSNGFCHYPDVVHQDASGKLKKGSSNFTCNVVYGQVGSSASAYVTLFHEGGHAADRLNSTEPDACLNTEYPPASISWSETQSMFLDTMMSSYEWKSRYALNEKREAYPFELFKRKVERFSKLAPLGLHPIMMVSEFEKKVFESKNLTKEKVISFARKTYKKYTDRSFPSLAILTIPHIYSFNSTCYYQGYGLASLAVSQWRDYFYKKYGHIVDNPHVGKEMVSAWKFGSRYSFAESVKLVTGKKLSPASWISQNTRSINTVLKMNEERAEKLSRIRRHRKPIDIDAHISLVHGTECIATNEKSFEDMCEQYATWLETQDYKNKKK